METSGADCHWCEHDVARNLWIGRQRALVGLTITTKVTKVAAELDAIARRQIPFATAVVLTRVSQDA
jgi:hypothetical protein